jgi:hypothetical protein
MDRLYAFLTRDYAALATELRKQHGGMQIVTRFREFAFPLELRVLQILNSWISPLPIIFNEKNQENEQPRVTVNRLRLSAHEVRSRNRAHDAPNALRANAHQRTPAQLDAHLKPRGETPAEIINHILQDFFPDLKERRKESVRRCKL